MEAVAVGGDLSVATLLGAYSQGVFPWYSEGQPIIWWSPDPRMVLEPERFQCSRSLRKTLQRFARSQKAEIRVDADFASVIRACAESPREGQAGTWILPEMQAAYIDLHRAGYAHSIETWIDGQLCGGLYCVAIGKAVFGESMFSRQSDASKIALAALVSIALRENVLQIDCQQNTSHLASLGAGEIDKKLFLQRVDRGLKQAPMDWTWSQQDWQFILGSHTP